MLLRVGSAAAGLVVCTCACSSFATQVAPNDGGPVAAPADARAADAGPDDAGDPNGSGFCARQPATLALCDDFDGAPLASKWSKVAIGTGGALDRVASSRSTPFALSVRSGTAGQDQVYAYVVKELGTAAKHVVARFDMRVDARGSTSTAVVSIGFAEPGDVKFYFVALIVGADGTLSIEEGDNAARISAPQFPKAPATGEWARFEVDVDLGTAALRARVNDAPTLAVDAKLTPPASVMGYKRTLELGFINNTVAGWSVAFDNVTCDST